MRQMRKIALMLCMALVLTMLPVSEAKADTGVTYVTEDGGTLRLAAGGTAQLQVGSSVMYYGDSYSVSRYTFASANSGIVTVDASGNVRALRSGSTLIQVNVYTTQSSYSYDDNDYDDYDWYDPDWYDYDDILYGSGEERLLFTAEYDVYVSPDLSDVTVDKTSQTGYATNSWSCPTYTFHLKSKETLTADWEVVQLSCDSSNAGIDVDADLVNNVLTIRPWNTGKTNVTVRINDQKICTLTINTILIQISTNSSLLTVKQTKQLRVKGVKSSAVRWSSMNPKVASVSANGMVKAKKTGNAVIKAKIGDNLIGCAVSVVTKNKKNTINTALQIARGTYSQPKRMLSGYYDCSSLVWRSYHKNGVTFGNAYYAPVAADIGKWCAQKNKMVKGGLSQKNISNMKLNAGDLMFETGENNGRYKGIYHVEMIVGYACQGFDYNGKPILAVKWAARGDGCYGANGMPVGRP